MLLINQCPVCGASTREHKPGGEYPGYKETRNQCLGCEPGRPKQITMLYTTSDAGNKPCYTHFKASSDYREIQKHLRENSTTMGFSIQYAYNPDTKHVVSIMVKGKMGLKLTKKFVELGYSEWFYSHSFSTKKFLLPSGEVVTLKPEDDLDLVSTTDIMPWARAFGYVN
jgi:hypothetical protein